MQEGEGHAVLPERGQVDGGVEQGHGQRGGGLPVQERRQVGKHLTIFVNILYIFFLNYLNLLWQIIRKQLTSAHIFFRYEGDFAQGKFSGKGRFFFDNLDRYEGEFTDSRFVVF